MDSKKKRDAGAALRRQVANRLAGEAGKVVEAHVIAERERCAGLMALSEQAARIGVSFDADAAIRGRLSLQAARNKVMAAAADGDAPDTTSFHMGSAASQSGQAGAAKAMDRAAMWRKAHEKSKPHRSNFP